MAAIDEVGYSVKVTANPILRAIWNDPGVKKVLAEIFWDWFYTHQNDRVVSIKWWFIRKSVYVRDIEGVFKMLFGPDPTPP